MAPLPVPGGGAGSCATPATPPVTVQFGTVGGKSALTDGQGCALYLNNQDTPTASACDATCVAQWPPLVGPGTAGSGVDPAQLATFTREDGSVQVSYFGHQLYRFKGDLNPGDANGQAQNQQFFLVDATGQPITQ